MFVSGWGREKRGKGKEGAGTGVRDTMVIS